MKVSKGDSGAACPPGLDRFVLNIFSLVRRLFILEIKIWSEVRTRPIEEPRRPETVDWRHREIILIIEKWRKPTRGVCAACPARHSHPGHHWDFLRQTI